MRTLPPLFAVVLLLSASTALAQYQPPNSLPWPLYRRDAPTVPREALGNSFGEYQEFGVIFAHSGIDIRGAEGDIVKVTAPGNIWVTVNYNDDSCTEASACRIYIRGNDNRYIYYYSHLQLHEESDITASTREKIINASRWESGTGTYPVQSGTDIAAGAVLSRIGPFGSNWPHLHFAIVDHTENYDAINPLSALNRSSGGIDIIDDERPEITALELFTDGTQVPVAIPNACTPISGNLDVAATVRDSFYTTDPVPHPVFGDILSTFGIYEAEYRIRNVATNAPLSGTWYRFDRAPLECAGPLRGLSCPVSASEAVFAQHSFLQGSAGIQIAEAYTPTLFATTPSASSYIGTETHVLLVTNKWGQAGSWNTASSADGWYQVSVVARDADGNQQSRTRFVAIDNHGDFVAPPDAFTRDNDHDVGALPSTLGGHPFWTSPDIFILPAGSPAPGLADTPPQTLLAAETPYDVYLRVHNESCESVTGLRAQIYSANPAMIVDSAQWTYVTPPGKFVPVAGITLPAGTTTFLGPFSWTPTAAEATSNEGHRCMLAKIDATNDAVGSGEVASNNNIAQRNLQFDNTSFSYNNPDGQSSRIDTEMRCNGFPFSLKDSVLELRVAYHSALYAAWAGAPGTIVSVSGGNLIVQFTHCNVRLPTVTLPGLTKLPASFRSVIGSGGTGSYTIDLRQSVNGVLRGGMSFLATK